MLTAVLVSNGVVKVTTLTFPSVILLSEKENSAMDLLFLLSRNDACLDWFAVIGFATLLICQECVAFPAILPKKPAMNLKIVLALPEKQSV